MHNIIDHHNWRDSGISVLNTLSRVRSLPLSYPTLDCGLTYA